MVDWLKKGNITKKVEEKSFHIAILVGIFIFLSTLLLISSLQPPITENKWRLRPDDDIEVIDLEVDFSVSDEDFKFTVILEQGKSGDISVCEFSTYSIIINGKWNDEILEREILYNFTYLDNYYSNEVATIIIEPEHYETHLYPFDGYRLRFYFSGFFIIENKTTLSSEIETTFSYMQDDAMYYTNQIYLDLHLNRSNFEQFSSILLYFLTLLFSFLLTLPNSVINLQQKTGASLTFLFTLYTTGSENIKAFNLLGIYQLCLTVIILGLLLVNGVLSSIDIKKKSKIRFFYGTCFYLILAYWNFIFSPYNISWNIPQNVVSDIWNISIIGLIALTSIMVKLSKSNS